MLPVQAAQPIQWPAHFSDNDKIYLKPIQTSYYTAWVFKCDEPHEYRIECSSDTKAMREARRCVYGHLPPQEDYQVRRKYRFEIERVVEEWKQLGGDKGADPNLGLSPRTIKMLDVLIKIEDFFENHIVEYMVGGVGILATTFFLSRQ